MKKLFLLLGLIVMVILSQKTQAVNSTAPEKLKTMWYFTCSSGDLTHNFSCTCGGGKCVVWPYTCHRCGASGSMSSDFCVVP